MEPFVTSRELFEIVAWMLAGVATLAAVFTAVGLLVLELLGRPIAQFALLFAVTWIVAIFLQLLLASNNELQSLGLGPTGLIALGLLLFSLILAAITAIHRFR
jgi:hypothetical protein